MTYPDRKALLAPTGRCMRVGCGKECGDAWLCDECAPPRVRRCEYPGCTSAALEDDDECKFHHEDTKRRKRRHWHFKQSQICLVLKSD